MAGCMLAGAAIVATTYLVLPIAFAVRLHARALICVTTDWPRCSLQL